MLRAKFKGADGSKLSAVDFNPAEHFDHFDSEDNFLDFCGKVYRQLRDNPENARLDITFDLRTKTDGFDWANERTTQLNELRSRQLNVTIPPQDEPTRTLFDVARLRVPTLSDWRGIGCPYEHWAIDGAGQQGMWNCPRHDSGATMSCDECWHRTAESTARAHRNPHLGAGEGGVPETVPASID